MQPVIFFYKFCFLIFVSVIEATKTAPQIPKPTPSAFVTRRKSTRQVKPPQRFGQETAAAAADDAGHADQKKSKKKKNARAI